MFSNFVPGLTLILVSLIAGEDSDCFGMFWADGGLLEDWLGWVTGIPDRVLPALDNCVRLFEIVADDFVVTGLGGRRLTGFSVNVK